MLGIERTKAIADMRVGLRKLAGRGWMSSITVEWVDAASEEDLIAEVHKLGDSAIQMWTGLVTILQPAIDECLQHIIEWYDGLPQECKDVIEERLVEETVENAI